MPFVIGILKPADYRCGGPDFLGKLTLAQSRFGPEVINLPRNFCVDDLFFVFLFVIPIAMVALIVKVFKDED